MEQDRAPDVSAITLNWRGRPLETHEVVVETIAATTTKTGLSIQAELDTNTYPRGIKITDKEMKAFEAVHLQRHEFSTGQDTVPRLNARLGIIGVKPNSV